MPTGQGAKPSSPRWVVVLLAVSLPLLGGSAILMSKEWPHRKSTDYTPDGGLLQGMLARVARQLGTAEPHAPQQTQLVPDKEEAALEGTAGEGWPADGAVPSTAAGGAAEPEAVVEHDQPEQGGGLAGTQGEQPADTWEEQTEDELEEAASGPLHLAAAGDKGAAVAAAGVGQGVQQAGAQPRCSIYVMDASEELASMAGVPPCNISDPELWPHDQPGAGVDGLDRTPHYEAQHASVHWLAKAIKSSSYSTQDLGSADLVFVDSHCYLIHRTAEIAYWPQERKELVLGQHRAVMTEGLPRHPRFAASNGSDFVLGVPHPGMQEVFNRKNACELFRHSFLLAVEKAVLCHEDQEAARDGRALLIPYPSVTHVPSNVAVDGVGGSRPIFLFHRGSCPQRADKQKLARVTSGKLLRRAFVGALRGISPDVEVECSCGVCPGALDHATLMERLQSSLFCAIMPGDTQSSRRLTEAVLAGCLPVFVGPPFHTLPLARDVNYTAFSVFVNMTNTTDWIYPGEESRSKIYINTQLVLKVWTLDADVPPAAMLQATTFLQLLKQLRAIPQQAVRSMQQALARERQKFMFAPAERQPGTALTDVVLARMCEYAAQLKESRGQQLGVGSGGSSISNAGSSGGSSSDGVSSNEGGAVGGVT